MIIGAGQDKERTSCARGKYKTILADPPWQYKARMGKGKDTRPGRKYSVGQSSKVDYPTMSTEDICNMPIQELAEVGCHLWLWTTNAFIEDGFKVMRAWGFKYLSPIHWVKPSGSGAWFINRTQTLLFGYKDKCLFNLERYKPNVLITGNPKRHSEKPEESYLLIESISEPNRLELFARRERHNWDVWGNEVISDLELTNV